MKRDILFLDANILFSAAWREQAGLLTFWYLEGVNLVSSLYALEEARRNLDLAEQRKRLEKLLVKVNVISSLGTNITLPENVTIREKDKPILLAVISSKADYLITGDVRDFGKFYGQKINGVMIIPPSHYLSRLRNIP